MIRVPLSALGTTTREDFDLVVQKHAQDLREHAAHQEATLNGDKARVAYPAPWSLKLVDDCIRRPDMVADYEIYDDGPTPEQRLRAVKYKQLAAVTAAERAAIDAIHPLGKRRVAAIRAAEINHTDALRANELVIESQKASRLSKALGIAKVLEHSEAMKQAIAERSDEDARFAEEHMERSKAFERINRHAAEQMAEIEDLTTEHECETWTMKPFPKG